MGGPGTGYPGRHRVWPGAIVYAYLQRFTVEEIAEDVGYCPQHVDRILRDEGCPRRTKGSPMAGRKPYLAESEKARTIREHRAGRTYREIGDTIGVSKQAIRQRLLRWGIISPGGKPGRRTT